MRVRNTSNPFAQLVVAGSPSMHPRTLVTWGYQSTAQCPRCQCTQETTLHVILCSGCDADTTWDASFKVVTDFLSSHDTYPALQTALLDCLTAWRKGQPIDIQAYPSDIRLAIAQQTKIGWLDLLEGLPAKQWMVLQRQYLVSTGKRSSPRKWLRGLMLKLHHLAWNQWNHRNKCNKKYLKPNDKQGRNLLHQAIARHMREGPSKVLVGDRQLFDHNLVSLFRRPLHSKQDWVANVIDAKQRYQRIILQEDDLKAVSQSDSQLLHWMKHGHFRMKRPRPPQPVP